MIRDGRLIHPKELSHLWILALAGMIGFTGNEIANPIISPVITLVILRITWDFWRLVTTTEPGERVEDAHARE